MKLQVFLIMLICLFKAEASINIKSFTELALKTNSDLLNYQKKKAARESLLGLGRKKILSPKLFIDSQLEYSKFDSQNPLLDVDKTKSGVVKIGAGKTYSNGLELKIGNESQVISLNGSRYLNVTNFTYTSPSDFNFYAQIPFAEVSMPLGRGFGGESIAVDQDLLSLDEDLELLNINQSIDEKINSLVLLYWTVAIKKKQMELIEQSLRRVSRIQGFVRRKVNMKIEEPGNLYQVQALMKNNETEVKTIALDINDILSTLKREEITVSEDIFEIDHRSMQRIPLTVNNKVSYNFLNRISNTKREGLLAKKNAENVKPNLDLYARASMQNGGSTFEKSFEGFPHFDKPLMVVGVNFLMDLDFDDQKKRRESYEIISLSNDSLIQKEILREEDEIKNLKTKLSANYDLYESLSDLSKLQLKKLENEQRLLNLGRSSLYQLLQYEQDYLRSEDLLFRKFLEIKSLELQFANYRYDLQKNETY